MTEEATPRHRKFERREKIEPPVFFDFAKSATRLFTDPLGSAALYVAYHDKGILGKVTRMKMPELNIYFSPCVTECVANPELPNNLAKFIRDTTDRLDPKDGIPTEFMGKQAENVWHRLCETTGMATGIRLTDYVAKIGDRQFVVATRERGIGLLEVGDFSYQEIYGDNQDLTPIGLELTVLQAMQRLDTIDSKDLKIYHFSSIANNFYYKRHQFMEREGEFFTTLRHFGVTNIGELQTLSQELFSRGLIVNSVAGTVGLDGDLLERWTKIRALPLLKPDNETIKLIRDEAQQYANEQVYYRLILDSLRQNHRLLTEFLSSGLYAKYADAFKDRHAAAFGATETETALNMLSGSYLYAFEGVDRPNLSPSQQFLAKIPGYHDDLKIFLERFPGGHPPLPCILGQGDVLDGQRACLKQIIDSMNPEDVGKINKANDKLFSGRKAKVLHDADTTIVTAEKQLARNVLHRRALHLLHKNGGIVTEGNNSRVGLDACLIANIGLKKARVEGKMQFLYPWLPDSSGYLGPDVDRVLPPLPEQCPSKTVAEALQRIFNGDGNYQSQEARIFEDAPVILDFLKSNENVPLRVRKFMNTLISPELIVKVLERFGDIQDNDPNIINRFFPEGVSEFHLASIYRYVFDFVRGVESNLLIKTSGKENVVKRMGRYLEMWTGDWANNDFSQVDDNVLESAILETIRDGDNRILELNHAVGESFDGFNEDQHYNTWKTFQEKMEIIFGWKTKGLEFTRWTKFWDIWHTLGGTWDCICFTRKTVFNPKALKTSF